MNFGINLKPIEESNPARTKHIILKRPQASWSQSVYSVPFGDKMVPNRDYPYEGLSLLIKGENWHILDGLAIGVKRKDRYIKLSSVKVTAYPWKMIYFYEGDGIELKVDYYLLDLDGDSIAIWVLFFLNAKNSDISIVIEPLIDIRHMYDNSSPLSHWSEDIEDGLLVGRDNKVLFLRTPICNKVEIRRYFRVFNWWYKLGSGFRENINGNIIFKGENKNPVSFGEIEIPANRNTIPLIIAAGTSKSELNNLFEVALREYEENEKKEIAKAKAIISALGVEGEVAFRALALTKYGMYVDGHLFQEAGDFWFRTPWLRDEFEGLLNNIKTFMKIPRGSAIVKNIILQSLASQDQFGRVPNRFLERKDIFELDYNSADATLLAFLVAGEYLKYIKDKEFAKKVLKPADITIEGFKKGDLDKVNGAPVLQENGLISVAPWHSWTDGKRSFRFGDITLFLPIRVPVQWEKDLIKRYGIKAEEELNKPKYFLPEINAQWIRMLEACILMADLISEDNKNYLDLLKNAKSNFRKVFYSENFLYNLVTLDGKKDPTLGSPAVVAISLLSDFIQEEDLKRFTSVIKENLLIKRKRMPFGILVRKSDKQIYYGDKEYHEAMVWPRDTPYLIQVLLKTGEREIVKGLLKSNLDHQMTEGFIFYNSELFSPDYGKVVPVKNPVQWWSQWLDPFLSFYT